MVLKSGSLMLESIFSNELLTLVLIIAVGCAVGLIRIGGVSLGSSAALFVAIAAGALGAHLPDIVLKIGIAFFLYAVGIQAGPRFFRVFGKYGIRYAVISIVTVGVAAASTILLSMLFHLDEGTASGMFAGAVTSTPALASAIDTLREQLSPTVALAPVSYAIAYPFGLVSEILFVQIVPRLFKTKIANEKEKGREERMLHEFVTKRYRLTNPNLAGRKLEELGIHSIAPVNITRYKRGDEVHLCRPETVFELGDVVVVVGRREDLRKFGIVFGDEVNIDVPLGSEIDVRDVYITNSRFAGKTLTELDLGGVYNVTLTRIYRGDVPIPPTGSTSLEVGDLVRVVGEKEVVDNFVKLVGSEKKRLDDTNIAVIMFGMIIGIIIGSISLEVGKFSIKLGFAGGILITAIFMGHFGKIFVWSTRMSNAAKTLLREIGLVFFLSSVGVKAGSQIASGDTTHGYMLKIFLVGSLISVISISTAFIISYGLLKKRLLAALGAICGAKTSGASLGALINTVEDESPSLFYASTYPVSVIVLPLFAELIVMLIRLF